MGSINVSIMETGTVRIRPSHETQSARRPVLLRRARVLIDRRWTESLPINTYLIDHPGGPILFDSGESPHSADKGYFPWWQPYFHIAVDIDIATDEGIGSRLAQNGIAPADLKAVVLSHLHHDHGDGLPELTSAPIYVSAEHWKAFRHSIPATMEGAVPKRWPTGFRPLILDPSGPAIGPWDRSYPLTSDGKVVAVDTPGHVPGHLSVLVFADDVTYVLVGDATYDQDLLDREVTDGVNKNPKLAVESLRRIKEFARHNDVVILPAHDRRAARRLADTELYRPSPSPR